MTKTSLEDCDLDLILTRHPWCQRTAPVYTCRCSCFEACTLITPRVVSLQ